MSSLFYQQRRRTSPEGRLLHSRKKLEQRFRKAIREGEDPAYGGVRHPLSCACYDCLWGEVRTQRELAKRPVNYKPAEDASFVPIAGRTGRFSPGRWGRRVPGVG